MRSSCRNAAARTCPSVRTFRHSREGFVTARTTFVPRGSALTADEQFSGCAGAHSRVSGTDSQLSASSSQPASFQLPAPGFHSSSPKARWCAPNLVFSNPSRSCRRTSGIGCVCDETGGGTPVAMLPARGELDWDLEAGIWKLGSGSWDLEAGSCKLEAGNWTLQIKKGAVS